MGQTARWAAMMAVVVVCYVSATFIGLLNAMIIPSVVPSLQAIIELVALVWAVRVEVRDQGRVRGRVILTLVGLGLIALTWIVYWPVAFVSWQYSNDPKIQAVPLGIAAVVGIIYRSAAARGRVHDAFAVLLATHIALTVLFLSGSLLSIDPSSPFGLLAVLLVQVALATGTLLPAALVVDGTAAVVGPTSRRMGAELLTGTYG